VLNVGVECPNRENLRLGVNDKYRKFIVQAASRAGIQPQGLAAMIDAEAAKISIVVEKQVLRRGSRNSIRTDLQKLESRK